MKSMRSKESLRQGAQILQLLTITEKIPMFKVKTKALMRHAQYIENKYNCSTANTVTSSSVMFWTRL